MELIAILAIAFILGPLGLFLIVMAALNLRDLRPFRAKTVVWLSTALLAVGAASMLSTPPFALTVKQYAGLIETSFATIVVLIVLMAVAMMIPAPRERNRAHMYGSTGLFCVAIAGAAFYALTQTNFSY